ncbi:MAG: permease [Gemmataceae bacterium]|nr:permease [Gemmataceae bacterium]
MSYMVDGYYRDTAASAPVSARAAFIKRTYLHLAGAILAFVGIEALLFSSGMAEQIVRDVFLANRMAWVGLMLLFVVGGMGAQYLARSRQPIGLQYFGLTLYVLLEVLIFVPLLYVATNPKFGGSPNLPIQAGILTLTVFGGLTIAVFASGKDFSFMGPVLWTLGFLALGLVIASVVFGFSLGLVFCGAMVALACGFIIYDTSNIIHRYGTNEHVAASLELFASVALLFYYILRIFWAMNQDD